MGSRWRKLLGDARAERGRLALMVAALTVSLAAVGTVLGAWGVLTREIAVNYLGTSPAEATLDFEAGVDERLLETARADPSVKAADVREVVLARVQVGDDFRPLLLFVPGSFEALTLNTFRPQSGAWPPPEGTVLLERSAQGMAQAHPGDSLRVKTPNGTLTQVEVSGLVHDPGLAPAWQEREVYAYATRATLARLGETGALHELRVTFAQSPATVADAEAAAEALAGRLAAAGYPVHQLRVPPPRQHPHQRQMATILVLLLTFAGLALVLSSVLVATTLSAMLARQVREIGVMKTLGARFAQLAGLYATLVAGVGGLALALSLPLAVAGALGLSRAVSTMLNFELTSARLPWWVFAVQAVAGVAVPLLFAAAPIVRAARTSVRAALDSHGTSQRIRLASPRWPAAVRTLLRRPARFALTVGLLATGGALFMTALAVSRAWERNLDQIFETRHYDVEVRFNAPQAAALAEEVARLPGLSALEAWGYLPAAFARPGHLDVVRTYPDRGHGSLSVLGPPPDTRLISFPVLAGRWLEDGDERGVVLNHVALAQAGGAGVGDELLLSLDGRVSTWKVVGVVQEVGSPAVAYVTARAFSRELQTGGASRLWRLATRATTPAERTRFIRAVEGVLAANHASVEAVVPFSELRTAIGDHVVILIQALLALAVILAIVGLLGLASALGVSVLERTREIAVMKTLGATAGVVRRLIVTEALLTSAVSWLVAVGLSLPLTLLVESVIGRLGFLAPLPFVLSAPSMVLWLGLLAAATLLATLPPVRRAVGLSVREALAET
jgi:putative ABC transport system permease protein